jgi:hypothetical protein
MKNVIRIIPSFVFSIIVFSFTGCYTEFAAQENNNDEYYANSDTTYDESGNVEINNNYYLDDDYRQSRFRLSFNYYYPSYHHTSWLANYYYSYYDDPSWGWGRPYRYYDPWGYGCVYPYPVYDPWWPYYPPVVYYPIYYPVYDPYPVYANNPSNPPRIRNNGATRDPRDPSIRTRPIESSPSPAQTVAVGATSTRIRESSEARPVDKKRDEIPWWKRNERDRSQRENSVGSSGSQEARPIERKRNPSAATSPTRSTRDNEARPIERRKDSPSVTSPPQRRSGNTESRPASRPSESQRPSYNPPAQSSPPASSAPRSGGGGSSGGRRRD